MEDPTSMFSKFLTEYGPLAIGWIVAVLFAWRLLKVQDKVLADYQGAVRDNNKVLDKMIVLLEGNTKVLDKTLSLVEGLRMEGARLERIRTTGHEQ